MFKIVPNPTFTATVRLSVPGTDAGAPVQVTYRHKGAKALHEWFASAAQRSGDAEFLSEVIEGWSGVQYPDGAAVPYSRDALAALLDAYPSAGVELVIAYRHQLQDARAKN